MTSTEVAREGVYQGPDETSAGILKTLEEHARAYTSLKSKLAAADGDREAALQDYVENSDDKQAVQIRERIKKATEQLRELADKNVHEVELSEDERNKIKVELEAHEEKINGSISAAKKVAGLLEIDNEGVLAAIETIGNPTKGTRGRPKGSAGSSVPRASVNIKVNGGQFTNQDFQTFSAMAMALKCDVKPIVEEFANAAGVEYMEVASVDTPQSFKFQAKEDGPKYDVTTTPKQRKSRNTGNVVATSEGPSEAPDFSDGEVVEAEGSE